MPSRLRKRLALAATLSVASLAAFAPAPATAAVTCDRYAEGFGSDTAAGTATQPFRTPQRLADSLTAGQTGCLLGGTYSDEITGPYVLRFNHGGRPGAPITIRSVPGQRAKLRGIVYVPLGSNSVTVSNLDIDGRRLAPDETVGVQVTAEDTIIENNTITNHSTAICMVLGSPGWGEAIRTVVRGNTFHDCGGYDNFREHSTYIEWTEGVLVTDNLFLRSGAYAVHLYPDAHGTTVSHNVMVGGGGGVIFAGEGDEATTDTVVSQNVITDTFGRPGIEAWWGDAVGSRNVARQNCLFRNPKTNVDISNGGFTASNDVIADPGFRDAAAGDYRLAANSSCLAIVGYDTASKLKGEPDAPAEPDAPPTPIAPAPTTPTVTPAPTATTTPTPAPTAAPAPTTAPLATTSTPVPAASPEPTPPPAGEGTVPRLDPDNEPVEAARLVVDDAAFSASGGSSPARPKQCKRRRKRCLAARR